MEALFELLIATYLTRGGKVFIAPQYPVPGDKINTEWSCPDFVALSFEVRDKPEVLIVEVTSASDPVPVTRKIRDRQNLWYDRVRSKLMSDGTIDEKWSMRFLGFVRKANLVKLNEQFKDQGDVAFESIEDAMFSWDYWERRKIGLPA
jgi:hypothetical protein